MRLSLVINAIVSIAVAAVVFAGVRGSDAVAFELVNAGGALSLSNSHAGAAILHGDGLRPGVPVAGTVTIGNTGSVDAALALQAVGEGETPGAGGGSLWRDLQLRIADGTSVVFEGSASALGARALGTLAPGGARTYAFTAWLPSGADDDAYQGARLSLGFAWTATGKSPATAPTPTPAPPAAPVAPAADPNATVTASGLMSLPSTCAKRTLKLKLHPPHGVTVKRVSATANGKKATLKRKGNAVTLTKLPAGKLKLKVTAVLGTGRKLTLARTYKSCAAR
jgi:hypothetical protein